jgi:hypothetical protein
MDIDIAAPAQGTTQGYKNCLILSSKESYRNQLHNPLPQYAPQNQC